MNTFKGKKVAAIQRIDLNNATFSGQYIEPTYINFIFGKNGTGKTTIAHNLRDGIGLIWSQKFGSRDLPVLVFDHEFIRRNIDQLDNLDGVFTLGEENIEISRRIEELQAQKDEAESNADALGENIKKTSAAISKLRSTFEQQCWTGTQSLRDAMPNAFAGKRGSKSLLADYVLAQSEAVEHDVEDLKRQYELAHDATATKCNLLSPLVIRTPEDYDLTVPIVSTVETEYSKFLEKLNASDWVRRGHALYAQQAGDHCPYCQQALPSDFEQTLKACFDTGYETQIRALQTFARAYTTAVQEIEHLPLGHQLRGLPAGVDLGKYDTVLGALKDRVASNRAAISQKLDAPSSSVTIASLDDLVQTLNKEIEAANNVIKSHNCAVEDQKAEQGACTSRVAQLIAHLLKQQVTSFRTKLRELRTQLESEKSEKAAAVQAAQELEDQIHELEASTVNTATVMGQINDHLRRSGFQGFSLKAHPNRGNTYQVVRGNGSVARGLSEGEQNFIAFLYFYFFIHGSTTPTNTRQRVVVAIDDPVSSMDTDALHIVAALVRNLVDECSNLPDPKYRQASDSLIEQIFVLTHNPYFMDAVSRRRIKDYRFVTLFKVTKRNNQSTIDSCTRPCPTRPTDDENYSPVMNSYAAMWEEYREVKNPQALLGICQRILDHYFLHTSGHEATSLADEILVENRHKFVETLDGGKEDVTRLNHAAALLAQLDTRHSPVSFDDVYATGDINEDQCRQAFRSIFEAMGQIQHYNMMYLLESER